jgi:hypothetical protein
MEDILFRGLDIPQELRKETSQHERKYTMNMPEDQKKAFRLGVDTTISLLRELLRDNEHIILHVTQMKPRELTLHELSDLYIKEMLAYTE